MTASDQTKSPPAPKREPAPGDLTTVQSFINTWDPEGRDELPDAEALQRWLLSHKLLRNKGKTTDADLRHAVEVREALRALLAANDGNGVSKDATETLSRAARSAQLGVRFGSDGRAELAPAASGVDAAIGEMLAIAFRAMVDGSWERLKICRDDTCRWAFYDRSRNRSGSWCLMSVCGNRNKARKFRGHRHQAASR